MKKLPTRITEHVYDVLTKYVGAIDDLYERETFIYHYSLVNDSPSNYPLICNDSQTRSFYCDEDRNMWVDGPDHEMVNKILEKVKNEIVQTIQLNEFKVTRHAI